MKLYRDEMGSFYFDFVIYICVEYINFLARVVIVENLFIFTRVEFEIFSSFIIFL